MFLESCLSFVGVVKGIWTLSQLSMNPLYDESCDGAVTLSQVSYVYGRQPGAICQASCARDQRLG